MRRGVTGVQLTLAALAVVLGEAAAASAQDFTIQDERVVEGVVPSVVLTISRTGFGPDTDVFWRTVAGSALAGSDFTPVASGSVHFFPSDLTKQISVQILDDLTDEWTAVQQDEVFFVELTSVVGAGTIQRGRATVTVVDDDAFQPGVQFLGVVTDSTGSGSNDGRNRLQWRVPVAQQPVTQVIVRWNSDPSSCSPPTNDTAGDNGVVLVPNPPGSRQFLTHDMLNGPVAVQVPRVYCYSVFTRYPALSTQRAEVITRTFDSTPGPLKWTYTPGYYFGSPLPSVVPPTVGQDAIYTVSTDGVVHAMQRGPSGGPWPATWNPVSLGKAAHNRSPVVPLPGGSRLFVGTENGEVHAVDARTGSIVWSRSSSFGNTQLLPASTGTQATPAGLFKTFGGQNDLILVGTATGTNITSFFALDPATGATIDYYPNGPIGPSDPPTGPINNVYGMAVVDYGAPNRVYFGTAGSAFTLWSLDLGPSGSPNLTLSTLGWNPKSLGVSGGTMGSPVLRNGRIYLGTDTGAAAAVHSLRVGDGNLYSYSHGDGQVKGFVWPDRRNNWVYFATDSKVHGVEDLGGSFDVANAWEVGSLIQPSIVLQKPGSNYLYLGDGNGRLLQIDVSTQAVTPLSLDTGPVQIGAPSLDGPNSLLLVGSGKGVIYAVDVSTPF